MNKFSWYEAKSIKDALKLVNITVSDEIYSPTGKAAVFKSGGVDLLDMIKEGIIQPKTIINIRNIPGLDILDFNDESGLTVGANVTLAQIEESEVIKKYYLALHQAVASAATPQIRNMATLGGNLAQRTRCWYFRSSHHPCFRKGGDRCFARNGENENHAIINNGSCVSLHASSISTALMVLQTKVVIVDRENKSREVDIDKFFISPGDDPSRENILETDEMITAIKLPVPAKGSKSYYIKQGSRESHDWSMADIAVRLDMNNAVCNSAAISLGAAAPTPIRSESAENLLQGKVVDVGLARRVAKAAMKRAKPLEQNGYKVPLFESIIEQAILKLV